MRPVASLLLLLCVCLIPQYVMGQNLLERLTGGEGPLNLGQGQPEFLDPEEAFQFFAEVDDAKIALSWDIAPGYYLYKERFKVTASQVGTSVIFTDMPAGEMKDDPEFGRVEIYRDRVELAALVSNDATKAIDTSVEVTYQGCAEDGICYPPIKKPLAVKVSTTPGTKNLPAPMQDADVAAQSIANNFSPTTGIKSNGNDMPGPAVMSADNLAAGLSERSLISTIAIFFGFGLLLSFTPCVFPMVPILSGIIVGQKERVSTPRAFRLSLTYVVAMATTYAAVGVIAGLFGHNLQATFQQPGWIIGFSIVFILLALSMFGFYNLEMPASWQNKLDEVSRSQSGGTYLGVAIMGVLSAVIVGPCVAPPFAAALLYLSHQGSPLVGGVALFSMALGMGALLLVVGTAAGGIMPRSGGWMDSIKHFFGVLLLGLAIWFLGRILPGPLTIALWAALLIITAVYLGVLEPVAKTVDASNNMMRGWALFKKGLGMVAMVYGVVLLVGASAGANDPLKPLAPLAGARQSAHADLNFATIKSVEDLDRAITAASSAGKPVMLDFFAEWCVECKHLEKTTFGDRGVQLALTNFVLLRADVTANDDTDQTLLKRFELFGPPALLFFDPVGAEQREFRVQGFLGPDKFAAHLSALKQS